jgi:D-alanine-D-alanine ligase
MAAACFPSTKSVRQFMKVVLLHDEHDAWPGAGRLPEDHGAEYDDDETIQALLGAIRAAGHEAEDLVFDPRFIERIEAAVPDMVFNIAEGATGCGRESIVPACLEHMGVSYTGSGPLALAMSLDKPTAHMVANAQGIPTPQWQCVESVEELETLPFDGPLFAKPRAEGSSMGIRRDSVAGEPDELRERVKWIIDNYPRGCMVEEYMPGREFCVGMLGNGPIEVLPVVEVRTEVGFYPLEDKSEHRKELVCPAEVAEELGEEIRRIGRRAYQAFECRDFARVDLKLDAAGEPRFLEINPLPGLSPEYSIFTAEAAAAGMEYDELIGRILNDAVERRTRTRGGQ